MSTEQIIQAKVSQLSAQDQAKVLTYLEFLETTRPIPEEAFGEVGAKLMMETLDPDEDWSFLDKKSPS